MSISELSRAAESKQENPVVWLSFEAMVPLVGSRATHGQVYATAIAAMNRIVEKLYDRFDGLELSR